MKKLMAILSLGFLTFSTISQAALISGGEQKTDIASVECLSSFGNLFCSGDRSCQKAAIENAQAKNCKLDIKKVESSRLPDYISGGVVYRSYSCSVVGESTCESATDSKVSAN